MSTDDRTARLAGVRERLRTATPGPWDWRLADTLHDEGPILAGRALLASEVHRHDAALIANAPADLAFLLALVDEQAAALDNACDYRAEHAAAWAALGDAPGGDLAEAIGWVVAKVREKAAEIARLRQGLWDCAGDAGADLDGQATPDTLVQPDLVAFARGEVRDLREAYDGRGEEVERLTKALAQERAWNDAAGQAEGAERAAVVAYLRAKGGALAAYHMAMGSALTGTADEIEAGLHRREDPHGR